jgi:DNA-directed RNA polymerase subunit RPC12/RpoP
MSEAIEVKCLQCGKSMKLKPEMAGRKGKCPICGKIINIPDPKIKVDIFAVNEDVSDDEVRKVAKQIAAGTGTRQQKKKGFFARIFGG